MSGYAVERYRPGLLDEVSRLEAPFWGASRERARAFFEWKYVKNPYTPEPLFYVALYEGRIVGARGMFATCWDSSHAAGKRYIFPAASDFMIAPEHRDSGLYRELNEYPIADLAERGYTHALNLSPTPANYVALVMSFGWKSIGAAGLVARKEHVGAAVTALRSVASKVPGLRWAMKTERAVLADLGRDAFTELDRTARLDGPGEASALPIAVETEPRAEAMVALARRLDAEGDPRLRHVRDPEYFTWRFDNPLASYRFVYWEKEVGKVGGEIDGWLTLQEPRGQTDVNIVDWQGISSEIRAKLLEVALGWGEFRNISTWRATLPEYDAARLTEAGFEAEAEKAHGGGASAERSGRLLIKPLGSPVRDTGCVVDGRSLDELDSWDLRMIWGDRY